MTALSDALRAANDERELSTRDIATAGGNRVSFATVSRYLKGQHPADPDDDALQTFSLAFGIPVAQLRRLAGQRAGESTPYSPPAVASRMTARQRRAVDELIRAIVETGTHQQQGDEHDVSTDPSAAEGEASGPDQKTDDFIESVEAVPIPIDEPPAYPAHLGHRRRGGSDD